MGRVFKISGMIFGGLALLFISLITFDRMIAKAISPKIIGAAELDRATLYKNLEPYREDLRNLKPKLIFLDRSRTKDAGPFLNPRVEWERSDKNAIQKAIDSYSSKSKTDERITINSELEKKLAKAKWDFLNLEPKGFSKIDTGWLAELRNYDYWEIFKNSPADELARIDMNVPIPNYQPLTAHLKIHLLKAVYKSNSERVAATLEVLHFGELALTNETLLSSMIFVHALSTAASMVEKYPAIRSGLGPWNSLIDHRKSIRRMYWGINQFLRPLPETDLKILEEIYAENSFSTGLCASFTETFYADWGIWDYVQSGAPEGSTRIKELAQKSSIKGCRLLGVHEKTPPWIRLPQEEMLGVIPNPQTRIARVADALTKSALRIMPYTKAATAKIMAQIAHPNWTSEYDKMRDPATHK